jgi:hypothetical protein
VDSKEVKRIAISAVADDSDPVKCEPRKRFEDLRIRHAKVDAAELVVRIALPQQDCPRAYTGNNQANCRNNYISLIHTQSLSRSWIANHRLPGRLSLRYP